MTLPFAICAAAVLNATAIAVIVGLTWLVCKIEDLIDAQ